jgi:hypothetical protein
MRILIVAGALSLAPLAATAASVTEATVTDAGGFDVTAGAGSSFPGDSSPFVGTIFGGEGIAISGVENFSSVLAGGGLMSALSFDIYEPTTTQLLEGCNTTCVDSIFQVEFFKGATLIASFAGLAPADDAITNYSFGPLAAFDKFVITETQGSNDNEFFANFSATLAPVPLPAGLPLLIGGLGGLVLLRRKKTRQR